MFVKIAQLLSDLKVVSQGSIRTHTLVIAHPKSSLGFLGAWAEPWRCQSSVHVHCANMPETQTNVRSRSKRSREPKMTSAQLCQQWNVIITSKWFFVCVCFFLFWGGGMFFCSNIDSKRFKFLGTHGNVKIVNKFMSQPTFCQMVMKLCN